MQVVYFDEELVEQAPDVLGLFYVEPSGVATDLRQILEAIRNHEIVEIRPASKSELKRAEAMIALYELGAQVGAKIGQLLDGRPGEALTTVTAFRDATESALDSFYSPIDATNTAEVNHGTA